MLATVDSKGIIRMATDEFRQWVPLLDLNTVKPSIEEEFWVFGLTDKIVNCVIIRVRTNSIAN
jgi:hypothetical protein